MQFVWKILSKIYSEIVVGGVKFGPPAFLFHQPNRKLECLYEDTILVDKGFSLEEKELIIEALKDLEYFCNGLIKINLRFDLDPEDQETINNNSVLLKVTPEHPSITASDEKLKAATLGLCNYMGNDTCQLFLVATRLTNSITFRTTAIHEFGHFIGLSHIGMPSIMHKHNNHVLYPTRNDAQELSRVWRVYSGDLRYFKL